MSSPSRTATRPGRQTRCRQLVANLADPEVAYVCGQLRLQDAAGTNREGTYWRYEMKLRDAESRLGSITGGNGSIYALNRADYLEVDPRWGHDLSFPYRMVQEGRRAVYEPLAHAFEKPTPSNETEYRRKVRMFEHCWEITLRGSMFRRLPPGYLVEIVSHRLLRYGSGILHLTLLASSVALVADGWAYGIVLAGPGGADRSCGRRGADRALLRARHLGDGRGSLELPATWRARDVGGCGGNPVNRVLDALSAGLGLAVASPLLAASAVAIKIEDGGPVFFHQTRVGRDGEDFELLKLRTMVVDAERKGAGYAVDAGDSRITRVGRILRRTSVDELPQLWNVVRGEMSLIGPRPTLRYQVDTYTERQRKRLDVQAGPDGLGAGARPRDAAVGRPDRARRLVRRAPLGASRPEDPVANAAGAVRRDLSRCAGRLAARRQWRLDTAGRRWRCSGCSPSSPPGTR